MTDARDDIVEVYIAAPVTMPGGTVLDSGATPSQGHAMREIAEAAARKAVAVTGHVVSISAAAMADQAVALSEKIVPALRERLRRAGGLDAQEVSICFTVTSEADVRIASIGTEASLVLTFRC